MLDKSFYHVGIVVPRLEEALDHLAATLGVRFGAVTEVDFAVEDPAGRTTTVPLRMVYSAEPPFIEVIEEVAGTPWVCNPHSNLHHIGFWAEGLQASHVVRVLMTHEEIPDLDGLASDGDEQADDLEPAACVEQDPAAPRPVAPRDEHGGLMPGLVCRPAGSQQPNAHPRPYFLWS